MSLLARIPRRTAHGLKGLDQEAQSMQLGGVYMPIESRQTWTDQVVSGDAQALSIATFYDCVRVLAEGIASLPLILYRRLPGGGKERATDHHLYHLFHDRANPSMSSFVWRELEMSHLTTWGNGYNEITFNEFGEMELWPIRPDRMEARWALDGSKVYDYLSPRGGRTTLKPGSVFHIPGLSPDGLKGYSPVALHRKTLATHNAAREFGLSTFRNNARPALVASHPKNLSEGAITRLAGQFDELRGSRNAGKTVILEEGLTLQEVGIPPKDAQYIESRVHESREIMKMFRMQPHKVGDLERATFSNIEEQNREHVQDTLTPWAVRIEQEIQLQLIRDDDYFVEFLFEGLLRGNTKDRSEALQIRRQNGTLNADDWREIENENPLPDGLGKTYWMPVNMTPVTEQTQTDQLPVAASPPLQVVTTKSAAVHCSKCSKLLAEQATAPYRFTCRACKSVTEADRGPVQADTDAVDGLKAAIRSLAQPPVVNVEAPIVNIEPPPPAEVHVHDDSFVEAVAELRSLMEAPRQRRIERDANGRMLRVVDE